MTRTTEKFAAPESDVGVVAGLDVQQADAVASRTAGDAPAGPDGHRPSLIQTDAPAVEQDRGVGPCVLACGRDPTERERALVLEEELALLREEQAEARQVDLRFVGLDLREVGVVREVGAQALRQPVLQIEAHVCVQIARERQACVRRSRQVHRPVRLHVQGARAAGRFQPRPRVAAIDACCTLCMPRPAGIRVISDSSFFQRLVRRALKPQIWAVPSRYRSDLNGSAISTVHPPSKRPVARSQIGFQSEAYCRSFVTCPSFRPPIELIVKPMPLRRS